jgi:lysozyme
VLFAYYVFQAEEEKMRTSQKGIYEIADHEGVVPYPYLDGVNVWTEGVGHTAAAGQPDPAKRPKGVEIPLSEVFAIFRRDLKKFEDRVNSAVTIPLAQHEFDALVSFDYNTGGIYRAALTKELNKGNSRAAAEAFMNWTKPASIVKRRKKEQALFVTGVYSNNGFVPVYTADKNGKVDLKSVKLMNIAKELGPSKVEDTAGGMVVTGGAGLTAWLAANGSTLLAVGVGLIVVGVIGWMIWRHRKKGD